MRNSIAILFVTFQAAAMLLGASGCTPSTESSVTRPAAGPKVTDIPLRILVLDQISDPDSVRRQWLSDSEQPIAIQSQTIDEFLAQERCQADVILYPDHLLGELVARDWVVKLPEALQPAAASEEVGDGSNDDGSENEARSRDPRAWQAAAQYEGVSYAVPLGCSLPVFVASTSFAQQFDGKPTTLEGLQAAIQGQSTIELATVPDEEAIDQAAVADRFLALVASFSANNKKYGLLFDLTTMKPRLGDAEFVQAALFLQKLANQPGGLAAVVGSHEFAWTWAATHEQPVLVIASSTLIGPVANKLEPGGIIEVDGFSFVNTGGGLQAALAASCQQTQQSQEFLKWLDLRQSRALLAPMIKGIDIPTPGGVESLAYRSRRSVSDALQSDDLFQEPRMPKAHALRIALGKHLGDYLLGKETLDAALAAANSNWTEIQKDENAMNYEARKQEYQRSLGLTQ